MVFMGFPQRKQGDGKDALPAEQSGAIVLLLAEQFEIV
jgi:hypothetical protein